MSLKNYVKRSLFLLICLSTNLYAAKPTIAVLDFDIKRNNVGFSKDFVLVTPIEDTTRILSSELIRYLVQTNKFSVVERDRMKDLLKEQEFSESGYISPETAVKMGKLIGADYFVMGRIEQLQATMEHNKIPYTDTVRLQYEGKMVVNVRIVASRAGKIVAANKFTVQHEDKNIKNETTPDDFLGSLKDKTAQAIVNGVIEGVFPLRIIKVEGLTVYINRGAGANFDIGTTLTVIKQGAGLTDPDTGEQLGAAEQEIGIIKITEIQQKFSKATILAGADHIRKGAIVRIKTEYEEIAPVRELTPGSSDKPVKW